MGQVLQFDPGAARHRDPDTSKLAASRISATHLERIVYVYLFKTGRDLTALEIARGMGMDIRSVSPRLKPLEGKGGVTRTGKRYCVNDAGNPSLMTTWLALEPDAAFCRNFPLGTRAKTEPNQSQRENGSSRDA